MPEKTLQDCRNRVAQTRYAALRAMQGRLDCNPEDAAQYNERVREARREHEAAYAALERCLSGD